MPSSIQTARSHTVPATPAGARAEAAVAGGRWLPVAWGALVVLCLVFWISVVAVLVAIS